MKIIKNILVIVTTLGILSIVNNCVSKNDDRMPNATSKSIINKSVDQISTPHGTLIVEWDNGEDADREGNHRPAFAPVLVNLFVVCKGSNTRSKVDSHQVCFYDGYQVDATQASVVKLGLRKQLKPVVKVNNNQLEVIPENDNNCNTPLVQTIDVKILCK